VGITRALGGPRPTDKVIIARILNNSFMRTRNGLIWHWTEKRSRLLCNRLRDFWFQKYRESFPRRGAISLSRTMTHGVS
jgi:hypothetical protein